MVRVDPACQQEYREAYGAWQDQLETLHRVFLEGEPFATVGKVT